MEINKRYFSNQHSSMITLFHSIFFLDIVKGSTGMQDFKVSRLFGIPTKARKISPSRMSLGYFPHLVALKLTVMAHHLEILFVVPMVLSLELLHLSL